MSLEIGNWEQIEAYLRDKQPQWLQAVATRMALRVLPNALQRPTRPVFRIFHANFIAWAAGCYPHHDLKAAMLAAKFHVTGSVESTDAAPYQLATTVLSASDPEVFSRAVFAYKIATSGVSADAFWQAVRNDIVWLDSHADYSGHPATNQFFALPLWFDEMPKSSLKLWDEFTSSDFTAINNYYPWIDWYKEILFSNKYGICTDYFEEMLSIRIATQSKEWWQQEPRDINADIGRWLAERDAGKIVIPDPEPGTTLGVAEDGRIGIIPSGVPTPTEQKANEGILEVLEETVVELQARLAGSNAFAVLLGDLNKYAACLRRQPLSIDQLYLRGNNLEIARVYLNKTIAAGDMPDMPVGVAVGLNSVLSTHGLLIASTYQGQVLLERSHQYENRNADIAAQRLAGRQFADAIAGADRLFSDEVREEWSGMADGIGNGPYPERSTQVVMSANRNLFIIIAYIILCETLKDGLAASVVGTAMTGITAETINFTSAFLIKNLSIIRELAAVSGPYLLWIEPLLRHVRIQLKS